MTARGSYAKGIAKREEILEAALRVVAREGYHGASVRELAEAVGLSQAGLLHYFPSKDELFEAILAKRDELDSAYTADPADPADMFGAMVKLVRYNQTVPGLVQLYAQQSGAATDPNHPSHGYFTERYQRLQTEFTEWAQQAQRDGSLGDRLPPDAVASILVAVMDGLQNQWLLGVEPDMAARLAQLLALLAP